MFSGIRSVEKGMGGPESTPLSPGVHMRVASWRLPAGLGSTAHSRVGVLQESKFPRRPTGPCSLASLSIWSPFVTDQTQPEKWS